MANVSPSALSLLALCGMAVQSKASGSPDTGSGAIWMLSRKVPFGSSLIINGEDAKKGQYKFYTAYERAGQSGPFCGGSLIDKHWALTAAHCNSGGAASNFQVRVSAYERTVFDPETEEVRTLTKVISHPKWGTTNGYDYGLLSWKEAVTTVTPIALFNGDTFESNPVPLTNIGMGLMKQDPNESPKVLQTVDLEFVDPKKCKQIYPQFDDAVMMCAGLPDQGSCFGDSGGPLFFTEDGTEKQVGVVSFGDPVCASKPAVYAKLNSDVLQWIESDVAPGV